MLADPHTGYDLTRARPQRRAGPRAVRRGARPGIEVSVCLSIN